MINVKLQIGRPVASGIDLGAVAVAINQSAATLADRFPQSELWEITATHDRCRYSVRNPLGETKSKVQAIGRGASLLRVGQIVQVCYYDRDRRRPYIKTGMGWGDAFRQMVLGLWQQAEANPMNDRGPRDAQASPTWSGTSEQIGSFPRYCYSGSLQSGAPLDLANHFSQEGVTLGPSTVAVLGSLYSADDSQVVGFLLREWNLDTETTTDWLHLLGAPFNREITNGANRRSGFLFYDEAADSYTVACRAGLLLCTRANTPTPSVCAWANTYGQIPPESSVNVAEGYAIQGAHEEYAGGDRDACSVDVYARGETSWAHVAQVGLASQLPDCDYVHHCGRWDPYTVDETATSENTRWPYLPSRQEWVVFIAGRAGSPGPNERPTLAKAKLLGIKADTGAVRVIHSRNAPLELLLPYDQLMTDLVTQLTYQSSHHIIDWTLTGIPGPFPYADNGNPYGYSTGIFLNTGIGGVIIPESDLPPGYGTTASIVAQQVSRFTGMTTSRDPTVAPDTLRLECAASSDPLTLFPMGLVHQATNRIYLAVQQFAWNAGETPDVGPYVEEDFTYIGNYTDFPPNANPDINPDTTIRCFSFERNVMGSAGYGSDAGLTTRIFLEKITADGSLTRLDLTRLFSATVSGRTYRYRKAPQFFAYLVAGDYLWVLAYDWWAVDAQRLTLILIATANMTEHSRIDLTPDTGLSWLESAGRPQMVRGVTGSGAPWVNVLAWWTGGAANEVYVQRIDLVSNVLAKTTLAHNSSAGGNLPDQLVEAANLAMREGSQFWIDAGQDLKRLDS